MTNRWVVGLPAVGFITVALLIVGRGTPPVQLPHALEVGPGTAVAASRAPASHTDRPAVRRSAPRVEATARSVAPPRTTPSPAPIVIVTAPQPIVVTEDGKDSTPSPLPTREWASPEPSQSEGADR